MKEKTVIYNNPLDGRMERYSGMAVTPDMVMEYLEYDIVKADEYLRNWASRHKDDCQVMGRYPLRIKIYLTPRETAIQNQHYRTRRVRR